MDLIYMCITAVFVLLTWGFLKICEVPGDNDGGKNL